MGSVPDGTIFVQREKNSKERRTRTARQVREESSWTGEDPCARISPLTRYRFAKSNDDRFEMKHGRDSSQGRVTKMKRKIYTQPFDINFNQLPMR
jgi:hypothetical protein